MSRLLPAQAPPPAVPAAFLLAALAWGAGASFALAWIDESALSSRWSPAVLALTHAFSLGLLGNALFGGLLQFVPAAAGGARFGLATSIATGLVLNLGTAVLLLHFLGVLPAWPAALLLGLGLSAACLGLLRSVAAAQPRSLSVGLRASVLGLLLTVGLGIWLLAARSGVVTGPRLLAVDVHAMMGLWAWTFGVLLSVCSLALPMLQGLERWSPQTLPRLLAVNVACVLLAIGLRALQFPFVIGVLAVPVLLAAVLYLWQLLHAPWRRNLPLRAFFLVAVMTLTIGLVCQLTSTSALGFAIWSLGSGLAMLILGMAIEILAFLAWLGLQRRIGRGRRLPGVHQLQGDRSKWLAFGLAAAANLLLGLGLWHVDGLRSLGAGLLGLAHLVVLAMGIAGFLRASAFARTC